jgi:MFS family permease
LALGERVRVRVFSAVALLSMALAALLVALAPSAWWIALALALYGPASGCATAASQGLLVEGSGLSRERAMARITLAAALGDLSVPLLFGALAVLDLSWRGAAALAAALGALLAGAHATSPGLDRTLRFDDEDDAERLGTLEVLRSAPSNRALLGWGLACTLISLLDEVLVAFVAVHLDGGVAAAVGVGALIVGGTVAAFALERGVDRAEPRRLLVLASIVAGAALLALALTRHLGLAVPILVVLGAASAVLHPLAMARAYASMPGRPALVSATLGVLVPIDAALPLVVGAVAHAFGSGAALAALLIAPIGVALAASRPPDP